MTPLKFAGHPCALALAGASMVSADRASVVFATWLLPLRQMQVDSFCSVCVKFERSI